MLAAHPFPPIVRKAPLAFVAAVSLIGYVFLSFWFPFLPHFLRVPSPDIRAFTPSLLEGAAYAVWLVLMYSLCGLAYQRAKEMSRPPRLAFILAAAFLFGLPLIITFPFNATDVFRYEIRGRIASIYHQNPFAVPPDTFPDDPYLPLAGEWAGETSPYGPIWELTAAALSGVSRSSFYLGLILFKGLGLLVHMAITAVIWQVLREAGAARRSALTMLWGWNPVLLLVLVVDAHNDGLMLLWLMLGFWMVRRGRPSLGFLLMSLAPLSKPIGLLPLPWFFLVIWRELPDGRARLRFGLLALLGAAAAVWLTFLPFGSPLDLAHRLLREASGGAGFSLPALIILVVQTLGGVIKAWQVKWIGPGLVGVTALWLAWRTWHGRSPLRGAADIFIAYLLQALNFRIWYAIWPFPWLLLDAGEQEHSRASAYRLRVGLWFLLTAQLSVLIYGHLRLYALGGNQLLAHALGVPFTLGLPFLLARQPIESKSEDAGR
ncbi:MAG: polyprenol phosphomannose-dependent alpha 1,6 mannosyltransferase MptB [Anaerolineae bacterium]